MLNFLLLVTGLFAAVLVCLEVGWRIRTGCLVGESADADAGLSAIDGAVFGLMGLLIAFTFSGAAARFEIHRDLIVKETNAIGTAWLRVDLLPPSAQPALRAGYRVYLDARIARYRRLGAGDEAGAQAEFAKANALQASIWAESVKACAEQNSTAVTSLVVSSLNDMIDVTTARAVALGTHPPLAIYIAMTAIVLASSVLAGYGMGKAKRRNWTHMLIYSATLAFAVYLILDLDYPRLGLVRIDRVDQIMVDLRDGMGH